MATTTSSQKSIYYWIMSCVREAAADDLANAQTRTTLRWFPYTASLNVTSSFILLPVLTPTFAYPNKAVSNRWHPYYHHHLNYTYAVKMFRFIRSVYDILSLCISAACIDVLSLSPISVLSPRSESCKPYGSVTNTNGSILQAFLNGTCYTLIES